jgi:hypothetical protein
MAPGKALTRIEPCPTVKNSSLSTIGSNPFGLYLSYESKIQWEKLNVTNYALKTFLVGSHIGVGFLRLPFVF